ncbi:MAG: PDZ domain-containing protein [Emergencia timonensis]
MQAGDMIYYLEDTKIETSSDLQSALSEHKPGETVKLTVIRNNKTVDLKVKLTESTQ